MDKEKQDYLKQKYPLLYLEYDNPDYTMMNSCMFWGFEVGNGWFDLIDRLSAKIEPELERLLASGLPKEHLPRASQVKEKFGTLRFYTNFYNEQIEAWINEAEDESARTCECCGAPGKPNDSGWISTLCDKCRKKR